MQPITEAVITTIRHRVRHYANAWSYRGMPLPTDELESAAHEICAEALQRFDPARGAQFTTFLWSELGRLKHVAWKEQRRLHREGTPLQDEVMQGMLAEEESAEELYLDDLSKDAQEVAAFLMERGMRRGKAPSATSTAYYMGWSRDRMASVWEELNCWWRSGGIPERRAIQSADVYHD